MRAGGVGCNRAADKLAARLRGRKPRGRSIAAYLPVLADALKIDPGPEGLRTAPSARAAGERQIFLAHTWFSSYIHAAGSAPGAIVVDSSEEMRDRGGAGVAALDARQPDCRRCRQPRGA